jgi:FixJ family two-component response regulator
MAGAGAQTVYVVEDDDAMRDALGMLLRGAGLKVRAFESPLEFLADYRPQGRDCLVLDVRMPRMSGPELQDRLIARGARIPVIFISGHGDIPMAVEAVRKGALDFLVKPFDVAALLRRVRDAFGQVPGRRRRVHHGARLRGMATLSTREREVLAGILEGNTNRAVAQHLAVSAKTVEYHRARIMRKLRVKSAAELFQFCLDGGEAGLGFSRGGISRMATRRPRG